MLSRKGSGERGGAVAVGSGAAPVPMGSPVMVEYSSSLRDDFHMIMSSVMRSQPVRRQASMARLNRWQENTQLQAQPQTLSRAVTRISPFLGHSAAAELLTQNDVDSSEYQFQLCVRQSPDSLHQQGLVNTEHQAGNGHRVPGQARNGRGKMHIAGSQRSLNVAGQGDTDHSCNCAAI